MSAASKIDSEPHCRGGPTGRHWRTLLFLAVGLTGSHLATGGGLAIMVPAYFYPSAGSDWERLAAAAGRVPIVAIMNPASGPGNSAVADSRYVNAVQSLRQAGGRVTGYVYTGYAKRALAEVKADLLRYHELYPLDGFFLDEMSNDGTAASVDYYAELHNYIQRLEPSYHVTGNPGTRTREVYLSRPTADTLVTFEDATGYPGYSPDSWNARRPSHQFCHLLHSVTNASGLTNAIALAQQRNAGFVFVTDDRLPNPWDRLPSYWEAHVNLVEAANRAAAEQNPPRLDLKRRSDGQGRLELEGPAGRYVIARAQQLFDWPPVSTNLTFTGRLIFEPILWAPFATAFFRARIE